LNRTMEETVSGLEEDTQQGRYLVFTVGAVSYGIEMHYIKEIVGIQAITALPESPDYYKGIINLRVRSYP
jgi:purine-binding chemotaxis protein CheW